MEEKPYKSGGVNLSYIEAGDGQAVHFAHANGFPAGVYGSIISGLSIECKVYALNHCSRFRCDRVCDARPVKVVHWEHLADELIGFLDEMGGKPYAGVGHSLGGVTTLIASVKRPDLFSKIIMLDPVLLPPRLILLIRLMRLIGMRGKFPLAVRARKRRDGWESLAAAEDYFRDKSLFRGWDADTFKAYIEYGMTSMEDGSVRLFCPPETEAQVFESYCANVWRWVRKLSVPAVVARGENSDTLMDASWDLLERTQPGVKRVVMPGAGHLFPLEKPRGTVDMILENIRG